MESGSNMTTKIDLGIPIVGAGLINPVAKSVDQLEEVLKQPRTAILNLENVPIPRNKSKVGLIDKNTNLSDMSRRGFNMAALAVDQAIGQYEIEAFSKNNIGVFLATMYGDSFLAENLYMTHGGLWPENEQLSKDEKRKLIEALGYYPNGRLIGDLCKKFGILGPKLVVSNACASGNIATGLAMDYIRLGLCKYALVVGVEVMKLTTQWGAERAGFVGTRLSPFDRDRDGAILGEGAACILLGHPSNTSRDKVLGWLNGFGCVCDKGAAAMALQEDGSGLSRAMTLAIQDANLVPSDVNYVNAHAPGTKMIDMIECRAISRTCVNCSDHISINSTKSITTHLSGASAITEIIATMLQIKGGYLHGNAGLGTLDPDLPIIPIGGKTISKMIDNALSNACGGGALNTSILVSRNQKRQHPLEEKDKIPDLSQYVITGYGELDEMQMYWNESGIRNSADYEESNGKFDVLRYYPEETNYQYMNRAAQLAAAASARCLESSKLKQSKMFYDSDRFAVIFSTFLGGSPEASRVMCKGLVNDPNRITPYMSLDHGAHLGAALVCRYYDLTGLTYTLTGSYAPEIHALITGLISLQTNKADAVLMTGYDSFEDQHDNIISRLGLRGKPSDSAASIVIENKAKAIKRGAPLLACVDSLKLFTGSNTLSGIKSTISAVSEWLLAGNTWSALYFSAAHESRSEKFLLQNLREQQRDFRLFLPQAHSDYLSGLGVMAISDAIKRKICAAIVIPDLEGSYLGLLVRPIDNYIGDE